MIKKIIPFVLIPILALAAWRLAIWFKQPYLIEIERGI
jgi:hypothetical protein